MSDTKEIQIINPEDYGLEAKKGNELTTGLTVVKAERELLINEFNELSALELTKENIPHFKTLRLKIAKNRTQGINKWHKSNKEFFLTGGRFVDAIKNKEANVNETMEAYLLKGEKYFEDLEKARLLRLQEKRVGLITEFIENAELMNFGDMDQEVWDAYFKTKKDQHFVIVEAQIKAEKERIEKIEEEKKEQERIRKENEQLRKEVAAKEKIHQASLEKQRKEAAAAAAKERKRVEAQIIKEREERQIQQQQEQRERDLIDAKLKKEKEEAEKVRLQLEKKQKAFELKVLEEKEKAEKLELVAKNKIQELENEARLKKEQEEKEIEDNLKKGDGEKVEDLVKDLGGLKTKYNFKSKGNKAMYERVNILLGKIIKDIQN
ncbi:MAG: hypothetical protein Unbinned5350contig1001_18 [Prokaryotic dsDNA virus sp.]|nr:MAG: hypothetical protein Unbinned5350contig1001_18 [Prokaryotic dsDNA virus sp.]|tara:strand:- start:25304 stop:26440 length:1137 start_codon:yes stop_codon:yes gene_type:complete